MRASGAAAARGVPVVSAERIGERPVVEFGSVDGYGPIFNAGALFHDGKFHLFARGVRAGYARNPSHRPMSGERRLGAERRVGVRRPFRPDRRNGVPRFLDYVSDILVFVSGDGRSYEFQQVLAQASPGGVYSYEDPRVQRVLTADGERIVMSYTNLPTPESRQPWRIGVHNLGYENGRFFLNSSSGRVVGPENEQNKDGVIFNLRDGRIGLIHRIDASMQLAVFDTLDELRDPPDGYWDEYMLDLEGHTIITPSGDALGVGAGAPPIQSADGLILLYHEREADGCYTSRAALLDEVTGRVKSLLPSPVMRPELGWERSGDVVNVVFVQGAVPRPGGTIYLTYGAADRCIGAARLSTAALLAAFRAAPRREAFGQTARRLPSTSLVTCR